MLRLRFAATSSLALLLAAGWLMGQDNKAGSDDATPAPTKVKGALPPNFKQLGLTEDQKQKVLKIHATYRAKIDALKEQISQLTSEERAELNKVLSDTQRIKLRELRSHEAEPAKSESKVESKAPEKK
jgi:Spy/CpxP family protein refolding chaperone